MLSESACRQTRVFVAITDPDALDGLQADHERIVSSFCVYVDAVWIPVPLILQMDNCKHLWYFCLQVFI